MPAYNKRFGKIGVKVITRTSVRRLTVNDSPNDVQSFPNFAKPPGRCRQPNESHVQSRLKVGIINANDITFLIIFILNILNTMKRIVLFFMLPLFFISCRNANNQVGENMEGQLVLNFNEQTSSTFFSDRIFEKIEMIPLETTDDCLVGERPELLADNNHFMIWDRQQRFILRFDRAGNFMNKIGSAGGGPGEYSDIMDYDIDPNTNVIEILASNGQILRYNYDGTFISSQNYGINPISFIKTGTTYWFNLGVSKFNNEGRLLKVSEDGKIIEKFLPLNTEWFGFEDLNFSQSGDMISFKESFSHTIYRIGDNEPVEQTIIKFDKYAIPKDVYERDQFTVFEELNNKGWANIYKYLENEQFVYVFFIVQQKEIVGCYHWLVNKKTGNSVLQKLLPDDPMYEMMREAKILSAHNELVFMANAQILRQCTDLFFNSVSIIRNSLSEDSNPVIISIQIKDF